MSPKIKIPLLIFVLAYFVFHIYTLPLNPLPWFDETFFVSIAINFAEKGNFIAEVSKEMWNEQEIFYHGPVFYFLQSLSYKVFGFSIVTFRWIPFVFGIFTVLATGIILRYFYPSITLFLLLVITFSLDPFLNLSLHEGRMDLIAVFFMLFSVIFLLKGIKEDKMNYFFLSGLSSAIALLTTPRVAIVFIAVGIVFLFSLEGKSLKKSLRKILYWGMPVLLLYYSWTLYAFGGIAELYEYYQNLRATTAEYVGGRRYVPKHEVFLIFITAISVIYGIIKKRSAYFNEAVIISFISIVLFYVVVYDYGPYSTLILPFYYFLLFHGISDLKFSWKNFSLYLFLLIFFFNLSFFGIKSLHTLSEAEIRNPEVADAFVKNNIPKGSRVIGGPEYYYSVIKSGSDYRLYDQFLEDETRERLLREVYDYEYFIITDRSIDKDPQKVAYFLQQAEFIKVAELKMPESELSQFIGSLGIVSTAEKHGYNAEIYVRIKNQKNPVAVISH